MIENDKKYQYSHIHYEAKSYVEDIVEESMNLYTWFENKLERDVKKRIFSEGIESTLSASEDLRIPITMICKLISEEMVKRACPPHDEKITRNLSNIILYVTSKVLTRLTRSIADIDYSVINFNLARKDLIALIILIVIQCEFDKQEHTIDTAASSFHKIPFLSDTKMSGRSLKNFYPKLTLI
jgi:hypothetical protein